MSIIICYACASDAKLPENNDNIQLRLRRPNKKADSSSESIKNQKQQQQDESIALIRSQLTPSQSSAINTVGNLATAETNVKPVRNVLQNGHLQMRQLTNPLNVGGVSSYAFNYPYQGYPMQTISPIAHQGYLFGNFNGASFEQATKHFTVPPHIGNLANSQPLYDNSFAPNLRDFHTAPLGLTQYGQNFPTPLENNLMIQATLPYTHAILPYNFGAYGKQISIQFSPIDYMNIYGPKFVASGSLPADVSDVPLLQTSQQSQPNVIQPNQGIVQFGALSQNEINDGFGIPSGLLPKFIRNRRMLGENNKEWI